MPPIGATGDLSRSCGLRAIEAGWISAFFDGMAPFSCLLDPSLVERHLGGGGFTHISMATSRSLWEWCGYQGLLLVVGIFRSSRSFIGGSSFFFISWTDVAF
jgi:hypothetical protein